MLLCSEYNGCGSGYVEVGVWMQYVDAMSVGNVSVGNSVCAKVGVGMQWVDAMSVSSVSAGNILRCV